MNSNQTILCMNAKKIFMQLEENLSPYSTRNWLPNANEMDTKNMKSTCPTPAPQVGDPTLPIFHLLALGFGIRGNAMLVFALGVTQILAFLGTNMLVSPTRNCGVGGLSQRDDPKRMVLCRSGI